MNYILIVDLDECARNISGCNQNCTNTIGSYFCSCYLGYEIQNDNRTCIGKYLILLLHVRSFTIFFVDTDECARNISGCNQNCTNTIGSYFCSCYPGYEIQNNNKTCIGKGV